MLGSPYVTPLNPEFAKNQKTLREAGFARAQKGTKFGTQRLLSKLSQLEKKIKEPQTPWMEKIGLVAEWEGTQELWEHKVANQRRVGVDPEKVEKENRRKQREYKRVKEEAVEAAAEAEEAKKKLSGYIKKNLPPPPRAAKKPAPAPKKPIPAGRKIMKDAVVDLNAGRRR